MTEEAGLGNEPWEVRPMGSEAWFVSDCTQEQQIRLSMTGCPKHAGSVL